MSSNIGQTIYDALTTYKGTQTTFEEESGEYEVDLTGFIGNNRDLITNETAIHLRFRIKGRPDWIDAPWTLSKIEKVGSQYIIKTELCPKCIHGGFIKENDSVLEDGKCITCESKGFITPQHLELIELGFMETIISGIYQLHKSHMNRDSKSFDFKLFRRGNTFHINTAITPEKIGFKEIEEIIQYVKTL